MMLNILLIILEPLDQEPLETPLVLLQSFHFKRYTVYHLWDVVDQINLNFEVRGTQNSDCISTNQGSVIAY